MPQLSTFHSQLSAFPAALPHNPALSLWLSVDPLSDKYPGSSPYVYCADNPVVMKDDDGRDYEVVVDDEKKTITVRANFVVLNSGDNVKMTQAAVDDWNAVSGKYQLKTSQNDNYTINFDLTVQTVDGDAFDEYTPENTKDNKVSFIGYLHNTSDGTRVYGEACAYDKDNDGISHNNIIIAIPRHKTIMHEIGHSLGLNEGNGIMEQGTNNTQIHAGHIATILVGARIYSSSFKSNLYLANQVKLIAPNDNLVNKNGFFIKKTKE